MKLKRMGKVCHFGPPCI